MNARAAQTTVAEQPSTRALSARRWYRTRSQTFCTNMRTRCAPSSTLFRSQPIREPQLRLPTWPIFLSRQASLSSQLVHQVTVHSLLHRPRSTLPLFRLPDTPYPDGTCTSIMCPFTVREQLLRSTQISS